MAKNNVCFVTGASSGIGKETTKELLEAGFVVYAAARRIEKMKDLQELGAVIIKMDITKEDEIAAAVSQIQESSGGVDILVNNAGFGSYGAMEDTPIEDAKYQFEVNIFGLARLTQLILPHMREQRSGKIINISSMGGKLYTPLGSWYHATKHALEAWSDCLRFEVAPFNIDVVIIEPGIIITEFGSTMLEPMMRRSGNSAYSEMAQKLEKATLASYEQGNGSPASVISKTILKAANSNKPKTRYAVGHLAKPLMFLRKWLPDRMFDWLLSQSLS
ncbi:MAG: oxidoreductase [Rivularia sp. ALOHA_DT_140]|nr:oxidoreductase [Rivularia sp. ALOHA_DT_140]